MPKSSFKPSKVVKKNLPSLGAWLTNAGKSVGVAAMDVITETLPATAEMTKNAAEFVQNFKSNITDLSSQKESIASAMDLAYWKDLAKTAKNNTIEDLKSGKLYHSMNDIYDENFGDDFDLDFGDDFDMGDDDDYDVDFNSEDGTTSVKTRHTKDGDTDVNQVNVKVDVGNDSKVAKMVESQTMAAVDYHREDIIATKESTTAIVTSISQSMGGLSGLMSSIDSNVASMTTMVTTISQGTSVQMKYYEDSMGILNTISGLLTEIKQTTSSNLMGAGQEQKEYTDVLDLFSGNGALDVSGYMNLVKKQFGSAVDRNFMLMTVKNMFSDKDQIKAFVAHPISNMINSFVKQVIPATLRETATAFDNTLRETLVSGLFQVRGLAESDNPILQFLGETFGITNKLKQNIDRANYKRGKVDWDGQSHKTLNEVIPYYLRKITSALTGEREVGFDYNAGVFKNVKTMRDEYQEDDNRRLTSGFSSVKGDFKDFLNKGGFVFSNTKGEKDVTDTMDKFLRTLVTSGRSIRRRKNENTGEYSFIDDVADIISSGDKDNDYVKLISAFLDTRERSSVMETLGRQILESRAAFSKFKQREESGEILTNSMYAKETGTTVDPGFDKDTGKALYNSKSPLIDKDKYGNTATYYLRSMLGLLAKGITTFPVFSGHTGLNIFGNNPNPPSSTTTRPNNGSDILKKLAEAESKYKTEEETDRARIKGREKDKEQIDKEIQNGKVLISNIGGDGSFADITTRAQQFEAARIESERDKSGDDSWFKKITGIDSDKPISKIVNKFTEYLTKPTTVITDMFKKADDFLFKLVFGGDLGVKNSVFKKSLDFVKNQFTRFSTWLNDSILEPLHEKFFGDNGLFNQLKQTQFGQAVSDFFGNTKIKLFGEKNDITGEYTGGFFSEYANAMGEVTSNIKDSLIGDNDDSVLTNVKNMTKSAAASIASVLGYDPEEAARKKEETGKGALARAIDDVTTSIKDRANGWLDSVLGPADDPDNTRRQVFEQLKHDFNGKLPKFAAGATVGAGVGLFSGAGPVVGAVGGLISTIVGESETIKQVLFGEMDLNTGERKGGIISREIMDFFNDNGAGIKTGAVLGGLANLISGGSLGIFGPVVGAVAGGTVSVVSGLDSVQRFLYGYDDKDGNHYDGFYDRMQNAFGTTDFKKLGIDAGLGAGVGLLGSFFLPGGPILGALIGAGASITMQTEKFKTFMFGDLDEETGRREGGLVGKVVDTITGPIKDVIYEAQVRFVGWMEQKVISPLSTAIAPILEEGKRAVERTKEAVVNVVKGVGNAVNDIVLRPMADAVKTVFAPIIDTTKKVSDMTLKVVGGILTSPIKLLQFIGYGLNRKHMKEGQRDYFDKTIGNAFTFNKDKRKDMGLDENVSIAERISSAFNFFGGFFNGQFKDSKFSEAGANYAAEFNGKKLTSKQQDKLQRKESKAWEEYRLKNKDKRFTNEDREKFDQENGLYTWWKKSETKAKTGINKDLTENMNVESNTMNVNATSVKLDGKLNEEIAKALTFQGYSEYVKRAKEKGEDVLDVNRYGHLAGMYVNDVKRVGGKVSVKGAADSMAILDKRERDRDDKYNTFANKLRELGKTPISRDEYGKIRDDRDSKKGITYVNPSDVNKEDIEGKRAKGGLIKKLGAYILSKGERVIPSGNKDDAEKEDSFFNKLKSRFSRDDATAKRKETQDEELKVTQAKGSFETKEKLRKEQAEKEEQRTWRETILESVNAFKEAATAHYDNWNGIFGKKGKIALALLALSPIIAKIAGYIVDLMNGQGLLSTIADHVQSAVDSIGGLKGVVERIKKLGGDFKELLFGKDSFLKRLENFIFPKNDEGENEYTGRSGLIMKTLGIKIPKGVKKTTNAMLKHQRAIRDQAQDYAEDARDSAVENGLDRAFGKDANKTWINRYDDVINGIKNTPTKIKDAGDKALNSKIGQKLFGKEQSVSVNIGDFYNNDQFMNRVNELGENGFRQVASDGQTFKFSSGSDGIVTKIANKAKGMTDNTINAVKNNKVVSTVSNGAKTAGKGLKRFATTTVPTKIDDIIQSGGVAGKATSMLKGAFDAIMKAVQGLVKKFGSGSSTFTNKLNGFFSKIVKTLTSGKNLSEFMSKVTAGIGKAASGIGILTGLAGGTKANTANLFFVDEEDVDLKMRAISLLWAELQNLPTWIPFAGQIGTAALIIDIVNELVSEVMGIDFIREASTLIYGIISGDGDTKKLTNAQNKFEQQYNSDMDELYRAYAEKQVKEGKEVLNEDEWKAEYGKSLNEYNDEKHKTIGHQIFDGIKGAKDKVVNSKVGTIAKDVYTTVRGSHLGDVFTKDYWAVSGKNSDGTDKDSGQILKEKMQKALMAPLTFVSGAVNGVIETLTGTVDIVKTTVKSFEVNTKTAFASITGGTSVFKPEYWDSHITNDKTDVGNLSQIAFYLNRIVMFLPGLIFGMGKSIGKGFGELVDKVKKGATLIKDTTDFSKINSLSDVFNGDYWKAPQDQKNPMDAMHRAVFYGGRLLTLAPSAVIGLGKDLGRVLNPILEPVKNAMQPLLDKISGAFKLTGDDNDNPPGDELGGINRVLYYTAKLLGFVPKVVMKIGDIAGTIITPVVNGIKTIAGSVFTGVEDLFQDPTRVFTKDFWTYDTADVGNAPEELGKMGMVLNVAGKILSLPIAATMGGFATVWKLIGPVASSVGSIVGTQFSRVKNLLTKGLISTDDEGNLQSGLQGYFDTKNTSDGPLGNVQKVLNTTIGVATLPFMLTVGAFGNVLKLLKPAIEIAKTMGGTTIFRIKNLLTKGLISTDAKGNLQSGLQNYFAVANKQDGPLGTVQTVLSTVSGITTLPLMLTVGAFGNVLKLLKPTIEVAKGLGGNFINRIKNLLTKGLISTDAEGNLQSGLQGYFAVANRQNGVLGSIQTVATVVQGITTLPLMLTVGAFGNVLKLIKPAIEMAKTMGGNVINRARNLLTKGLISTDAEGNLQSGLQGYFDVANRQEGVLGAIQSVLTVAQGIATLPIMLPIGAFGTIFKLIKPVAEVAKGLGGNLVNRVKDLLTKGFLSTDAEGNWQSGLQGYFDVANRQEGPLGAIQSVLTIVQGITTFPLMAAVGTFGTVKNMLVGVVSSIPKIIEGVGSGAINRLKNLWNKGIITFEDGKLQSGYQGFFDVPNKEAGPLGVIQTILSGIVGVTTFPISGIMGVVGTVKNLVTGIFKGIKYASDSFKESDVDTSMSLSQFWKTTESKEDTTGIGSFLNLVGRVMYSAVFLYKKHIEPVVQGVKDFFSPIGDWIDEAFKKFKDGFDEFKDKFGSVLNTVRDFFGFGKSVEEIQAENGTITNGNGAGRRKSGKERPLLGGNGPTPDTENGFPYYSQNDPRIKNKPYRMSNGQPTDVIETMGNRGCGPTAMAMVASKLKGGNGNPYSPENMARIAESGNYSTQNGTMPNYFTNVGTQLGMNVTPALATAGNIDAMLGNGQPVIIQGASDRNDSPFTSGGHYVVAVGKDDSGNVLVNDPRGKSYSGKYTMNQLTDGSARAWGFSNPGGFGGTIVNTVKGGFGKVKKLLKSVMGGNGASWIDVVKAVKKAIASKKPGYSQTRSIKITVGGRTISVRTDCSGMVSACISIYGGKNYLTNSTGFTNKSNSTLLALGFKPLSWSGWNNLQEGDIISKVGHVEIFCRNSDGKHYVYNAGGTDSINNPNATKTGHSSGYTTVWRAPGKSVDVNVSTSGKVSTSGTETSTATGGLTKYSAAISQLASEMLKPFQPEQTGDTAVSTSKDYSGADISGSDTAQKVWNFFTSIGYSKAATAGILGNLYQESGVNPKSNADKPNSPAAGIAQWENFKKKNGRWKKLSNYAASKGKKWTDLKSQLEFIDKELHGLDYYFKTDVKYTSRPGSTLSVAGATPTSFAKWVKSTDVDMATRQFEGAFERAGKPNMPRRVNAAKKYYKLYAGGNGEGSLIGGNGDMEIPYVDNSSREIRNKPQYHRSSDDSRYISGNGYGYNSINQSLSRTEKLSKENSAYDDANVVAALGTVVSTLEDLLVEMRGTNEGVNKFNDKELVVKNTPVVYQQTNNNNIQAGNGSGETQKPPKTVNNSTFIDDNKYRLARSIASGGYSFA